MPAKDNYKYTQVLDQRTSGICKTLDGKIFKGSLPDHPSPGHYWERFRCVNIPIIEEMNNDKKIILEVEDNHAS